MRKHNLVIDKVKAKTGSSKGRDREETLGVKHVHVAEVIEIGTQLDRLKNKKKKVSTQTKGTATNRLTKRTKRLESSTRGLDLEKIVKNVHPGEKEYLDEYIYMFRKTARLIRKKEKQAYITGSPRDIYALSTLISQQREIIADIRTLADLGTQVEMVKDNVLRPMIASMGQNVLDVFYQIRRLMLETCDKKQTEFALLKLEEITKEQSKFLQVQYQNGAESIQKALIGEEPVAPKIKKKRKTRTGGIPV
jgi:hypothetical protein